MDQKHRMGGPKADSLPASCPALLGNSSCLSGHNMLTMLFEWLKGVLVFSKQVVLSCIDPIMEFSFIPKTLQVKLFNTGVDKLLQHTEYISLLCQTGPRTNQKP